MTKMVVRPCSDCGFDVSITPETLAKGNSVREPEEALCNSCSSARIRLVQAVKDLPGNLRTIQSRRMVGFRD